MHKCNDIKLKYNVWKRNEMSYPSMENSTHTYNEQGLIYYLQTVCSVLGNALQVESILHVWYCNCSWFDLGGDINPVPCRQELVVR